tara:strand:+ start:7238 stop:8386 length:1149 start_codon:yes stop_codon:yes gene_type:complete
MDLFKEFKVLYDLNEEKYSQNEKTFINDKLGRFEEYGRELYEGWNWEWPMLSDQESDKFRHPQIDNLINEKETDFEKKVNWPRNKSFALCLTHDVDYISVYPWKERVRSLLYSKKTKINDFFTLLFASIKNILLSLLNFYKNTSYPLDKYIGIEESLNFKSTFFFVIDYRIRRKSHTKDCFYSFEDSIKYENKSLKLKKVINLISEKGWEIGLHGSIFSQEKDMLLREKIFLEKIISSKITSNRFHYLNFDIEKSIKKLVDADFSIDCSLGSNVDNGYRCGTGLPYKIYNNDSKELFTLPLIIQDNQILSKFNFNKEKILKEVKKIFLIASKNHSCVTLLWHPNFKEDSAEFDIYKSILELANEMNAWGCSAFDLVSHINNK